MGGTCLKKCYFETYRFSEDLDFTLRNIAHINEDFLRNTFSRIGTWVYENSGIEIPPDRLTFEIYQNPRGVDSCQGRVYYRGPVTPAGKHSMPRVKLDLTTDEVIVETPVITPVRHDYSDGPEGGIHIQSYAYAEVFAEKIRALEERTMPRDLYDVINFYLRPESHSLAEQVRIILTRKCEHKGIPFPQLTDLEAQRDICATGWKDQLGHQLQVLPPFDSFWGELRQFFLWLEHPDQIAGTVLPAIPSSDSVEGYGTTSPLPTSLLGMLDRIRFAAVNRMCVEIDYRKENGQRQKYLIEPYSLRTTAGGYRVLYGVKLPSNETRSFRTDRIISVTVHGQAFTPCFTIDFIPTGPVGLNVRPLSSQPVRPRPHAQKPRVRRGGGLRHVFRCTTCGKTFTRSTQDSRLQPHKNKQGSACYGRFGAYVKTNY